MASKDEGSRTTKEVAAKNLNEERLDMRAKRLAAESVASQSETRAFGR